MSDTSAPAPHAEGAGGGIKATLTRKLGPFPAWVYIVAIAGGAWLFYFWKSRNGSSTTATVAATPSTDSSNTPPADLSALSNANAANPVVVPETNAQWAVRAANGLGASGQWSPTDISNALANLLNGQPLVGNQQAIVNAAEAAYGVPPEGVILSTAAPVPAAIPAPATATATVTATPAPAAPAPAAGHTYTVQRGDNLTAIARKMYGNTNWQQIYDANRDIINNPNLIYAGQVLTIPA